ncbi:MAG: methyltransferase domain-containing protein [Rhodospirillales bacterium]|nr:MAG: methyltransferase domain-containing protein [Rhodospirillales bacterium]
MARKPDMAAALVAEAAAEQERGAFASSLRLCQRALELDPRHADAHLHLGVALRQTGQPDEALRHLRRAVKLKPRHPLAHLCLGELLGERGHRDGHAEHLATAYLLASTGAGPRERLVATLIRPHLLPRRPGPRLRQALSALIDDAAVDRQRLVRAVMTLVRAEPSVAGAMAAAASGVVDLRQGARELYAALASPPVLCLLETTIVADDGMEVLLTALRRAWLESVLAGAQRLLPQPRLLAAAALQAEATGWVWAESAAERDGLRALEARLQDPATRIDRDHRGERPSATLLTYALYRPVGPFVNAATIDGLADDISESAVLRRHVTEPARQARLADSLSTLTGITDPTSRKVRAQYEESPYPRWRQLPQRTPQPLGRVLGDVLSDPDLGRSLHHEAPRILVAGCGTGRHALATATRFRGASVLAVDLSRRALAYAADQAERLGIGNVRFAQADIVELDAFPDRFDVIECSGVLHHMTDPEAGWAVLRRLLAPGGLMRIALYSVHGRAGIDRAQAVAAEQGLAADAEGIRALRAAICALPTDDPARIMAGSADFYSMAGCRDMFFHVHEDRFTLDRIERALAGLDLDFLGFELPDARMRTWYRQRFPDDPGARVLGNWQRLEEERPDMFAAMYQFWCRARD